MTKQKTRKAPPEKRFEKRIAKIIKQLGVFSYHVAERNYRGIPDRYVAGGNWIEFKVAPCSGKRNVNPFRLFSPSQRVFLDKFSKAGDRTWACVMFQPEVGAGRTILVPWHVMREHGTWSPENIADDGATDEELVDYIGERFGRRFVRCSNGDLYGSPSG